MELWIPKYKIGDEVYVFIYHNDCQDETRASKIIPEFILHGIVRGYSSGERYDIEAIKIVWKADTYDPFWLRYEKTTTYHYGWVEEYETKDIEKIAKALGAKKVSEERVSFD